MSEDAMDYGEIRLIAGVPLHTAGDKVPPSIAKALSEILGAVGNLEKKGHNKQQGYDFARETDLVDMLRPMMAEKGLFLHQTVVSHSFREQYTTKSGSTMWLTTLGIAFTWVYVSGDVYPVPGIWVGYGSDTGDKGVYKAATGAEKYFLMKTFLVSTGDDPEGDEKVDEHAAAARASGGTRVTRGNQAGQQRGGRSTVATEAQRKALKDAAKRAGVTTGTELMSMVAGIIRSYGEEPPEWENPAAFAEYLAKLDSTRMGQLVLAAEAIATDAQALDTAAATVQDTQEGDDDGFDIA